MPVIELKPYLFKMGHFFHTHFFVQCNTCWVWKCYASNHRLNPGFFELRENSFVQRCAQASALYVVG